MNNDCNGIRPLYDRVLVRIEKPPTKSKGGIILPQSEQKKQCITVKILAIGCGTVNKDGSLRPLAVKVGNRAHIGQWAGVDIDCENDANLKIIKEDDILAIIEE